MDAEWRGYSAAAMSLHGLTRGAPVLKWAAERLRQDKTLVQLLVWANPSNLCFASPALQADAEVVAAALASPFYAEPPPPEPASCVLCFAAEELRVSRETVLAAIALSGYEFEFAGDALRADAYVAAWAGAPVGAVRMRQKSKTFMRTLKSGVSVEYMDAHWKSIMQDDCYATPYTMDLNFVINKAKQNIGRDCMNYHELQNAQWLLNFYAPSRLKSINSPKKDLCFSALSCLSTRKTTAASPTVRLQRLAQNRQAAA